MRDGDRPGGRAAAFLGTPVVLRLASSCIGSVVAGLVVGGLGSRLAMRVSAIAAGDHRQGLLTDNGNAVGTITAEGTLALVVFVGLAAGLATGVFLAAMRTVLPGRFLPLSVSLVLLALGGPFVIDPANPDFTLVGNGFLNVAMFAALFPAFGCGALWIAERFDGWLVRPPLVRLAPITIAGAAVGLVLGILGVGVFGTAGPLSVAVVLVTVAAAAVTAFAAPGLAGSVRAVARVVLAVGVVVGGAGFLRDVIAIVG